MPFSFQIQENSYNAQKLWTLPGQSTFTFPQSQNVTIPFASTPQPAVDQKLTAEGNVPLVQQDSTDKTKGLAVETKSTPEAAKPEEVKNTPEIKTETETKQPQAVDNSKMANKRDINTVMKLSAKDVDWDKLSLEDKQKEIIKFLENTPEADFKYVGGRKGWLKSFLANNKNMDSDETKMVVGALKYFNVNDKELAKLQADGINLTSDKLAVNKETAQTQVVTDMEKYGLEGQNAAVDVSSKSEFDNIKLAGSKKVSLLDASIQAPSVSKYMEGAKTSSEEIQKQIGFNLVDQYGKYAKEAELDIHKTISSSTISEIVERAAANVYKFDKENQKAAVQITINTGNEKAITAAASQYANYDKSVQSEVKSAITSSASEVAKTALADAEAGKTTTQNTSDKSTSSSNVSESEQRIAAVKAILNSKQPQVETLKSSIKVLSDVEKISLIRQYPSNGDLIHTILNSNPSIDVLNEVCKVLKDSESIKKIRDYKTMLSNIGFLNASMQLALVKSTVTIRLINRNQLCNEAKCAYDNKLKENGVKEKAVTA